MKPAAFALCFVVWGMLFLALCSDTCAKRECARRECKPGMVPVFFDELGECICAEDTSR